MKDQVAPGVHFSSMCMQRAVRSTRELDGTRLSGVSRKDAYLLTVQGHFNQRPRNLGFFCFFLQSTVSYPMHPHTRSSANSLPRPASCCGHKTLADGETGEGLR